MKNILLSPRFLVAAFASIPLILFCNWLLKIFPAEGEDPVNYTNLLEKHPLLVAIVIVTVILLIGFIESRLQKLQLKVHIIPFTIGAAILSITIAIAAPLIILN